MYDGILRAEGGLEWWEQAETHKIERLLWQWWEGARRFADTEGDTKVLEEEAGSLGEYATAGECLCFWLQDHGINPQLIYDIHVQIEGHLDCEKWVEPFHDLARRVDRVTWVCMHVGKMAWLEGRQNGDTANGSRNMRPDADAWCYNQKKAGKSYRDIVRLMSNREAGFDKFPGLGVGSPTAVGDAIKRHCRVNKLPKP